MKNRIVRFLLAAAVVAAAATPARAQVPGAGSVWDKILSGEPAGQVLTAVSTDTKILIKYRGSNILGGTVTVAANGDVTLAQGAVGAATADATVKCPSGGSNGVLDVSDAACDTFGEILALINASANWMAVPVSAALADSSNDTLVTKAETAAGVAEGVPLLADGTVALNFGFLVGPAEAATDIRFYSGGSGSAVKALAVNPFQGYRGVFTKAIIQTTYGSGSSLTAVLSCKTNFSSPSEVCITLWSEASAATATDKTFDWTTIGGLLGRSNERIIVRTVNTAALTAAAGKVAGIFYKY